MPFGYKGRIVIMGKWSPKKIQGFLRGDEDEIHAEIIEKAAGGQTA